MNYVLNVVNCFHAKQKLALGLSGHSPSRANLSPFFCQIKHFGSPCCVNSVRDRQFEHVHVHMLCQTTGACMSIVSSGKGVNVFFLVLFARIISTFSQLGTKVFIVFHQLCRFVLMGNYIFFRYLGIKQSQLPSIILKQRQHQQTCGTLKLHVKNCVFCFQGHQKRISCILWADSV